jgi:hypothetical protein
MVMILNASIQASKSMSSRDCFGPAGQGVQRVGARRRAAEREHPISARDVLFRQFEADAPVGAGDHHVGHQSSSRFGRVAGYGIVACLEYG